MMQHPANGLGPDDDGFWEATLSRTRAVKAPAPHIGLDPEPDLFAGLITNATAWHDVRPKPREWIVRDYIPAGEVTLFGGDGGLGKSLILLQLAMARAVGQSWVGLETKPGKTLYLSSEDDKDECHRRCEAIRQGMGISFEELHDFDLLDLVGGDAVLGAPDPRGRMTATPVYDALVRKIEELRPDLVILDSLADVFAGHENDRQHARQFIGLLKRLCREREVTVIVLYHPSVSGMSSGTGASGNTHWSNSARSRLYFDKQNGDDASDRRTLTRKKSNYAKAGDSITLHYVGGAFIPDEIGGATPKARAALCEQVFLELLDWHVRKGIPVRYAKGRGSAAKAFSEHHGGQGYRWQEFQDAATRLLDDGRIKNISEGPPSKPTSRIVRS